MNPQIAAFPSLAAFPLFPLFAAFPLLAVFPLFAMRPLFAVYPPLAALPRRRESLGARLFRADAQQARFARRARANDRDARNPAATKRANPTSDSKIQCAR